MSDTGAGEVRRVVGHWNGNTFSDAWKEVRLDLTPSIDRIAQYELSFRTIAYDWDKDWGLEFTDWHVEMYGKDIPEAIEKVSDGWTFRITRSQQSDRPEDAATVVRIKMRTKPGKTMGDIELRRVRY